MKGEFTYHCKRYYELMCRLKELKMNFYTLLDNALPYTGQTTVAELDAIIYCNRKIQEANNVTLECAASVKQTGQTIIKILDYFGIPAGTKLTCEIPGFAILELWADDEQDVHCIKTRDLDPLADDPNLIIIDFAEKRYGVSEDEEE